MDGNASSPTPVSRACILSHKPGFVVIIISYYRVSNYELQPTPRCSLQATTVLSAILISYSLFLILLSGARSPRMGQVSVPFLQYVLVCESTPASDDLVAPSPRPPAGTAGVSQDRC